MFGILSDQIVKRVLVAVLAVGFFSACGTKDADYSALQNKTQVEAKADRDVQNQRAMEMEKDLQTRYRFYQALKNVYEGQFKIGTSDYGVRLVMTPSIPLYQFGRVRTIEEVTEDLNSLYLNSQIVIWNLKSEISASGCIFQETRPNLITGQIILVNRECPNFFAISVSDGKGIIDKADLSVIARDLSKAVLAGEVDSIGELSVSMQPTNNAQVQKFGLIRKE